jgi:type II secretory pathway component PulC
MKPTLHINSQPTPARWIAIGVAAALALAAVAYFASGTATPEPESGNAAAGNAPSAAPATGEARPRAPEFPKIKLALIETRVVGDTAQAVIEADGQSGTYQPGQDITQGIRLNAVESDHVVLAFAGSTRILWGTLKDGAQHVAPDIRERNRSIEIAKLTPTRPRSAEAFLRDVLVKPNPRGGFEIEAVTPGSMYAKLGLQPGDVVFSLDTPKMAAIDENSMVALIAMTEVELDIFRNGQQLRLKRALNVDEPASGNDR